MNARASVALMPLPAGESAAGVPEAHAPRAAASASATNVVRSLGLMGADRNQLESVSQDSAFDNLALLRPLIDIPCESRGAPHEILRPCGFPGLRFGPARPFIVQRRRRRRFRQGRRWQRPRP